MNAILHTVTIGAVAIGVLNVVRPVHDHLTVIGLLRTPNNTIHAEGGVVAIADTVQCEDVHYYQPSNELFTACQDESANRFGWFPPLDNLADYTKAGTGSLRAIDAKTFKSRRLSVKNMPSPFVSHGIDVMTDPEDSNTVHIFAVNHPPALCWSTPGGCSSNEPKENATIEVFTHTLGSSSATHVRSVRHPLIRLPNDIVALSPTQFWVTNDHKYDSGAMRFLEDALPLAKWSDTVFVSFSKPDRIEAHVVLTGLHNNNGLSHGPNNTLVISSAASGRLHFALSAPTPDRSITVFDHLQFPNGVDNPSYFTDPMPLDGDDASGFIVAGLTQGYRVGHSCTDPEGKDPIIVWHARKIGGRWERRVIFEDDGSRIRSASAAVCVPGEGFGESGEKEAWCFVTGFLSKSMLAFKADLGW